MKQWNYENDQWTKLPIHLRHLPLFTRHYDLVSLFIRGIWAAFLKFLFFKFYIRLEVKGDFKALWKNQPRLLIISNHASHLDAISIAASMPFRCWIDLYIAAAKDYFFSNLWMTYFSQHCIGAIPIDRNDRKGTAVKLCLSLLNRLDRIWLVIFPEGTRSKDGLIYPFKKGVSVFSERSYTPLLFLYLEGNYDLWPKGAGFARPGKLVIHVGPVHEPARIDQIFSAYKKWVSQINPAAFANVPISNPKGSTTPPVN